MPIALLLTLLLSGCATATLSGYAAGEAPAGASAEQLYRDNQLVAEVNRALIRAGVDALSIQVDCRYGVVTLSGRVGEGYMRERAELAANRVEGVRRVDNRLTTAR